MTQESIVTPLAILFVTSSPQGNNIPFRWPPNPSRPKALPKKKQPAAGKAPNAVSGFGSWGGDGSGDDSSDSNMGEDAAFTSDPAPTPTSSGHHQPQHKSSEPAQSSHLPSGRPSSTTATSPAPSPSLSTRPLPSSSSQPALQPPSDFNQKAYDLYFDVPTTVWASVLAPAEELCQQRFELVDDDMCFIGHPMRGGGPSGLWTFGDEADSTSSAGGPSGSIVGGSSETGRGRRQGPRVTPGQAMGLEGLSLSSSSPLSSQNSIITGLPPTSLEDVLEGSPTASQDGSSPSPAAAESSRPKPITKNSSFDTPTIGLFHFVIVVNQRDRSNSSMKLSHRLDALYREVVFKATAALFDAQVKQNWVATHAMKLVALRDTCIDDQTPWTSFLQECLDTNPLAQAVKSIFDSLNAYPFSATIKIASLPLYIQLPLLPATTDSNAWSYWENHSPLAEDEEEDDVTASNGEGNPTRLSPWKTILLLDPQDYVGPRRTPQSSRRGSTVFADSHDEGGGAGSGGSGYTKSRTTSATYTQGRRSRETSGVGQMLGMTGTFSNGNGHGALATPTVGTPGTLTPVLQPSEGTLDVTSLDPEEELSEEEKMPVFRMFRDALRPNLSLSEIAHLPFFVDLGLDLKKDIYPMARLLVWKRKARVIDVVKPASKNIYFPGTSEGKDMPHLIESFNSLFPTLAPFYRFFSLLSASPTPYSHLKVPARHSIITNAPDRPAAPDKRTYYEALLWMLRKDLVVGAPTRVRVMASREIKVLARRLEGERRKREEEEGSEIEGLFTREGDGESDREEEQEEEEEEELIANPAGSRGMERGWLNSIPYGHPDPEVLGYQKLVRYFDGKITLQEMQYREGMSRKEVIHVLKRFEKHLILTNHT